MTHLLQIKDRHNGNILLDRDGHLIHIDFGFMLANSPGNIGFEAAPFKLPLEYIEVLGGLDAPAYREFRKLFREGFDAARKHCDRIVSEWILAVVCADIWKVDGRFLVALVELMQKDSGLPCFVAFGEQTASMLRDRFQQGLTQAAVEEHVQRLIDASLGSNWTRLYDSVSSCDIVYHETTPVDTVLRTDNSSSITRSPSYSTSRAYEVLVSAQYLPHSVLHAGSKQSFVSRGISSIASSCMTNRRLVQRVRGDKYCTGKEDIQGPQAGGSIEQTVVALEATVPLVICSNIVMSASDGTPWTCRPHSPKLSFGSHQHLPFLCASPCGQCWKGLCRYPVDARDQRSVGDQATTGGKQRTTHRCR